MEPYQKDYKIVYSNTVNMAPYLRMFTQFIQSQLKSGPYLKDANTVHLNTAKRACYLKNFSTVSHKHTGQQGGVKNQSIILIVMVPMHMAQTIIQITIAEPYHKMEGEL